MTESDDLPESYHKTRVVVLPIHPYLVHVYWDVAPDDLEGVQKGLRENEGQAQACLRFYDVTYINFDGTNAHSSFDTDIDLGAGNWYVELWSANKSYCVDLGFRSSTGAFRLLARSNVVQTAPDQPSMNVQERYSVAEQGLPQEPPEQAAQRAETEPAYPPVDMATFNQESILPQQSQSPVEPLAIQTANRRAEGRTPKAAWSADATPRPPRQHAASAPIDMSETLHQRLTELYGPSKEPPAPPAAPDDKGIFPRRVPERPTDITEMNERGFAFGISSKQG